MPDDLALGFVQRFGYLIILAATFGFVFSLIALAIVPQHRPRWDAGDWKLGAAALAGAVLWQLLEPHGFKVLMDELVIQGTAMTMHFDREILVPLRGHEVAGEFLALGGIVDKRPNAFPLVTSLVHDLTGYRTGNVFAVNAVLSGLLLLLVGRLGRHLGGRFEAGLLGLLLLLGLPLLALNATGAGMEVLNLVMISGCVLLGRLYLISPSAATQNAFVLSAVILAQVRYESAAFVAAAAILMACVWWRERRPVLSWALVAAPILLILVPLQNRAFSSNPLFWELPEDIERPFGLQHVPGNLALAFEFFFSLDGSRLGSPLLAALGLSGGLVSLFLVWRRRHDLRQLDCLREHPGLVAFAAFSIVVLANFALVLSYHHWGQLDDFATMRLGLPMLMTFAVVTAMVAGRCLPDRRTVWTVALALPAAWIVFGAAPVSQAARATNAWRPYLEVAWQLDFVRVHEDRAALFVLPAPLVALNARRAGISVARLGERAQEMSNHLTLGTYDDVYVFQRLEVAVGGSGMRVSEESLLGPEFLLEALDEVMLPGGAMRRSRLTGVDLARQLPRPAGWTPKFPRAPSDVDRVGAGVESDALARRIRFLNSLP